MFIATCVMTLAMAAQPAAPPLEIALAFDAGAPPAIRAAAVEEAARIWAPYGVAIRAAAAASGESGVVTLRVSVVERPAPGIDPRALGSIPFHDAIPEPVISLYAGTVSELVSSAEGPEVSHWPDAYRAVTIGRVLGRALAHETGHFLLRSPAHSMTGLMRASPSITELMDVLDRKLGLSTDEQAVLNERRPQAARAGHPGCQG